MIDISVSQLFTIAFGALTLAITAAWIAYQYGVKSSEIAFKTRDQSQERALHLETMKSREMAEQIYTLKHQLSVRPVSAEREIDPASLSSPALWTRAPAQFDTSYVSGYDGNFRVVCVANFKGGVGKTTFAANLGAYLAERNEHNSLQNKKVLFIDLDFQGSLSSILSQMSGIPPENRSPILFREKTTFEDVRRGIKPKDINRYLRSAPCAKKRRKGFLNEIEHDRRSFACVSDLRHPAEFAQGSLLRVLHQAFGEAQGGAD